MGALIYEVENLIEGKSVGRIGSWFCMAFGSEVLL